jgi:heterodisulfide reductase subunit A
MPDFEPRIGVFVCECGINISSVVDVAEVVRFASSLPLVVVAQQARFTCSRAGQDAIKQEIRDRNLNRVIVASCSPRMHEATFQNAVAEAGINPYCLQMTNIREHVSWVVCDPVQATSKAKRLVSAAVSRVTWQEPLSARTEPVTPAVLVLGAGIAGIQTALTIAESGYQVYLVEREPSIGGHMAQLDKTFPTLDCST